MAASVGLRLRGLQGAIEGLATVSKDAHRAQLTAMRKASTAARREVVGEFVKLSGGAPRRLWKKRVRAYPQRRREGLAVHKIWSGHRRGLKASTHRAIERKIRATNSGLFQATMPSGHRGLFKRKQPTRAVGVGARDRAKERGALPIVEPRLDLGDKARGILERTGREAMRDTYVRALIKDFRRRTQRRASRRR